MKIKNILSLFDGISAGQFSLNKVGINFDNYYSSEINQKSILVTQTNFPNTIQLGDVRNWKDWDIDWSSIDLLFAGFPCNSFTITKKRTNFNSEHGKLFFIFRDILNHIKKYNNNIKFLAENVVMLDEVSNIINKELGVKFKKINSSCFSAQNRIRYYWFNWNYEIKKSESELVIRDILEKNGDFYWYKNDHTYYSPLKPICATINLSSSHELVKRVNNVNFKSRTLTGVSGGYQEVKIFLDGKIRKLTPIEYERLMNLPDNYTGILKSKQSRYDLVGNSWEINTICDILKSLKKDLHK